MKISTRPFSATQEFGRFRSEADIAARRKLMCAGHPRNADAEWQRLAQHPATFRGEGRECPQL
jgi:hypothetical protein